jgi:hypothetical protein
MTTALEGACLCGAVQVAVARRPRQVTQCNCSVCRRYGTLWGYYRRGAVTITARRGALAKYPGSDLEFVRCKTCGCVVCWDGREPGPDQRMGVNMRLFDHALMADVPVKVLDGDQTWRTLGTYTKPDMWISPKRARGVRR